jgi:hypothetical protein
LLAPSLGRMTQLTALDLGGALVCIGGSCAVIGCLRPPALHGELGMLRAEAVACGALAGGGGLRRRVVGRCCVQPMRLEMMGQRCWHRVSEGWRS